MKTVSTKLDAKSHDYLMNVANGEGTTVSDFLRNMVDHLIQNEGRPVTKDSDDSRRQHIRKLESEMDNQRELDEDRLLDLIISLEALFQDDIDELKFRLSIRTASFLEKENSKKNKIFKTILEGYKIRSKTAHGKDISKISIGAQEITLVELTDQIEQYVRQSILEFINRINQGEKRDDMMKTLDNDLFL